MPESVVVVGKFSAWMMASRVTPVCIVLGVPTDRGDVMLKRWNSTRDHEHSHSDRQKEEHNTYEKNQVP